MNPQQTADGETSRGVGAGDPRGGSANQEAESRGKRGLRLASRALVALALALARGAGTVTRQGGISDEKGISVARETRATARKPGPRFTRLRQGRRNGQKARGAHPKKRSFRLRGQRLASRALVTLALSIDRSAGTAKRQGRHFQRKRAFTSRGKLGLRLASRALVALTLARSAGTAKYQGGISKEKSI